MKYIRIFFTFLGYCTFIAGVCVASFWYIGYRKNQARQALRSTDIAADTIAYTTAQPEKILPDIQPISTTSRRDKKTVVRKPAHILRVPQKNRWAAASKPNPSNTPTLLLPPPVRRGSRSLSPR